MRVPPVLTRRLLLVAIVILYALMVAGFAAILWFLYPDLEEPGWREAAIAGWTFAALLLVEQLVDHLNRMRRGLQVPPPAPGSPVPGAPSRAETLDRLIADLQEERSALSAPSERSG